MAWHSSPPPESQSRRAMEGEQKGEIYNVNFLKKRRDFRMAGSEARIGC